MSYIEVEPGVTWCEDTPENWREFERLKAELQDGGTRWQAQMAREAKRLRRLASYTPGHEPDRVAR